MNTSATEFHCEQCPGVVLIVDDAPENLAMLHEALDAVGYRVLVATDGYTALARVAQLLPDVILLDAIMPGLDGFETCRKLRSNPELRHVPIAFLTARKTPADVTAGMQAGGNDFIVKPFDPLKLIERIRYWMSRDVGSP